jgi:hypothetical protein
MKIDAKGKAQLEVILRGMYAGHPADLVGVTFHESGETATVQVADKYYRYSLSATAQKILQGQQTYWTELEAAEFFTPIQEAK